MQLQFSQKEVLSPIENKIWGRDDLCELCMPFKKSSRRITFQNFFRQSLYREHTSTNKFFLIFWRFYFFIFVQLENKKYVICLLEFMFICSLFGQKYKIRISDWGSHRGIIRYKKEIWPDSKDQKIKKMI